MTLEQQSLLDLLAHDPRKESEYADFLAACRAVRLGQRQYVSINSVRERMSNQHGLTIEPRRYSSFFSRAMREGSLLRTNVLDVNSDERSRNKGKPCWLYRWVGGA